MNDRGTSLFIAAPGLGASPVQISISLDAPTTCIGGQGGFSNVPQAMQGDPYAAVINFLPSGSQSVAIAGLFASAIVFALVSVPEGDTISGSVSVEPALTHDLKIQTFTGGDFTLPAGQTSGTFSFPFESSQTVSGSAKTMGQPSANA